jgi:hypothetical protein
MRAPDPRFAREFVAAPILPGLPGGSPYVSDREMQDMAMVMFESVAEMRPGMVARRDAARKWGLGVEAPRVRAESALIEVRGVFPD